jgi:hypothetical protein
MSYPYLPVNPCCTDVVINDPCGCSSTITNSGCNNNNPCSTHLTASSTIVYDGPALTCTTAEPCDTLNVILQKIDEIICNLLSQINILTNQVSNITTQIITINGDIINIYNTLDVCCNVTTTTTSTTAAPCESFSLNNTGTETVAVITTDCDTGELVAVVLEPGVTNICVQTDSPLSVPGTITVTPNGPCGPTTTTTSSSSTTTTTTTVAFECQCFTFFNNDTSAHVINYKDCNNINVGPILIASNETIQACAGSGSASDPRVIITVGADCIDGACPVPTTTTTTTLYECTCYNTGATISQELLDVTDNGQIILNFNDCDGNPQENIYDTAGFYLLGCVNFIPGIDSTALIDGVIVGLAIGPVTIYEQCCPESPTTTTTTTIPPTTTTTTTVEPTTTTTTTVEPTTTTTSSTSSSTTTSTTTVAPTTTTTTTVEPTTTTTSTSSSTTTTTTTAAPTTTTTTTVAGLCICYTFYNTDIVAHNINYKDCSGVNIGPVNIDPDQTIQVCGGSPSTSDPSVTFLVGADCIDGLCPTTTTTTTADCNCVSTITLDVTEGGTFDFIDCSDVSRSAGVTVGVQTLDYSEDGCITKNTQSGTAMYTILEYGPCCSPTTTTTTTLTPV